MSDAFTRGMVDVRDRLYRNGAGGPNRRVALAEKWGVVIHYNGPAVTGPTMDLLLADSLYHVRKNWAAAGEPAARGDGLMYHVAVGPDGTTYLCRDLEAVLWHCGAWPQNATALAVLVALGRGQRATAAQLAATRAVVDAWLAAGHGEREQVWGHQELSPTACPGSLMADFVRPYRAGTFGPAAPTREENRVRLFPETKQYAGGGFLAFWEGLGEDVALRVLGYPLTGEFDEGGLTVQVFERAVMEFHPEDAAQSVKLRRLGAEWLVRRDSTPPT